MNDMINDKYMIVVGGSSEEFTQCKTPFIVACEQRFDLALFQSLDWFSLIPRTRLVGARQMRNVRLYQTRLVIAFLAMCQLSFAQNSFQGREATIDQRSPDDIVWENIKNQPAFPTMDRKSQEVLYWTNFVRMYPRRFYDDYAAPYINNRWGFANPYCVSLKEFLYKAYPAGPLQANRHLNRASYDHATDLKRNQLFQHESSNRQTFQQRIFQYIPSVKAAENLHNGTGSTPFGAVMSLLVDDGIPSVGHRLGLMDPAMLNVGITFVRYDSTSMLLVQDFCGKL